MERSLGDHAVGREERWRLALLVLILAATALALAGLGNPFLGGGRQDSASHADVERKLAAARHDREVARLFQEGVAMLRVKDYGRAAAVFQQVLALAPAMPEAHVNAGYAFLGLGDAKSARDAFDTATNLRPDQINAYFGLGESLLALGDTLGALQAMETYVHRAPENDPFRRKAEAAAWELRAKLAEEKGGAAGSGQATGEAPAVNSAGSQP